MSSELMAIILCFMGIVSIFIFPRFTRWWYKQQLRENGDLTTDSEYVETEQKKYAIPMNLAVWGNRIAGIIFFIMAAFIYFTDFLG